MEDLFLQPINVLMIGSGEYTTGYVHGAAAASDKSAGVVALCMFDLRRRGRIADVKIAGTSGTKFPGIRQHLRRSVADIYREMDVSLESFPADHVTGDPTAYRAALATMSRGDVVTVFTPDDTHYQIALDAIQHGCHVLIAKPLVKTIEEHRSLIQAARSANVLVAMEVHKRWDPIYLDARDRIRQLGEFSYFSAYMSQPKSQLDTFRAWAGRSSDISYYLNAHHIDFNLWAVGSRSRPATVVASASTGYARSQSIDTEDSITLTVQWENPRDQQSATAVYTASWIAPQSDVHSQQRFFYVGHHGEIQVDQAHRGYTLANDAQGFASPNPLFMKYTPDEDGYFSGQSGYGYRSLEAFVDAAASINAGTSTVADYRGRLATAEDTVPVTAILEAGRRSLDQRQRVYQIDYDQAGQVAGLTGR